jgi:hypothetical protein
VVANEDGRLSFAEIEIAKRLRAAGWQAGWLDAFGRAPETWKPWIINTDDLPEATRARFVAIHDMIAEQNGRPGSSGRPDIVAWQGDRTAFIELKGPRDRLSKEQARWGAAALAQDPDSYGLVRWSLAEAG